MKVRVVADAKGPRQDCSGVNGRPKTTEGSWQLTPMVPGRIGACTHTPIPTWPRHTSAGGGSDWPDWVPSSCARPGPDPILWVEAQTSPTGCPQVTRPVACPGITEASLGPARPRPTSTCEGTNQPDRVPSSCLPGQLSGVVWFGLAQNQYCGQRHRLARPAALLLPAAAWLSLVGNNHSPCRVQLWHASRGQCVHRPPGA